MNVLYDLLVGLLLGFSLTIPPGPMNAYIATLAVRSRRLGTIAGLGAMSADAVLGLAVFSLSALVDLHSVSRELEGVGAGVLGVFAYRLVTQRPNPEGAPVREIRTYSTALLLGVSNPFQIVWWLSAGLAFAYLGGVALFAGLFGAIAIWVIVFPWALHAGARRSPVVERATVLVSFGVMAAFAAYFAALALGA